jgi:two-component system nitrate/nitrite response regulator NarL
MAVPHVFLFSRTPGRWLECFEGAAIVSRPVDALRLAGPGTIVWADVTEGGWMAEVRTARPDVLLVALTLNPNAGEAMSAFERGARGYCHALAVPEMLKQVALVVSNGGLWLGADLMARAAGAIAKASAPAPSDLASPLDELTPRERDVALQVAEGASNKEVARRLDITARTVKAHMSAIFEKLSVRDRLQLVLLLRRSTPIPPPMVGTAQTCTTVQ